MFGRVHEHTYTCQNSLAMTLKSAVSGVWGSQSAGHLSCKCEICLLIRFVSLIARTHDVLEK